VGATLSYTTPGSVRVHGDLDFRSAPLVRDALVEAISQPLGEDVQVDLAGVTFLDCAGLGALIAASNAARTRARRIFVTNPSGAARRVLEICDLLDPLTRGGETGVPR
jgi:anti-anti-sigma factor